MPARPNIVFILPDQLRSDFLGCYGVQGVGTPHMDRLAEEGVRYTNAVSASPVCVPARTALMTGMNAVSNGVLGNLQRLRGDHREAGVRTWPEILSEAGYRTAAIGKMHFYPWDARLGFQHRVIAEDKRWLNIRDDYYRRLRAHGHRKLHGNERPGYRENLGAVTSGVPLELTVDHFVGQESCRYLDTYGHEQPFALMVGFPGPHCPFDPTPAALEAVDADALPGPISGDDYQLTGVRSRNLAHNAAPWNGLDYSDFPLDAKRRLRHHYAALVKQIDDEVGAILASLERGGLLENTAVVLASDHGDYLGDHDLVGKGSFFEGAIRVPLIVRPPGGLSEPRTQDELVELRDVTATLLRFAGVDPPPAMDAVRLPGLGHDAEVGRRSITGYLTDGMMQLDGRYKLHRYLGGETYLFDLHDDPEERRNLAELPEHQSRIRRMDADLIEETLRSLQALTHDRHADSNDLALDPAFGFEGWRPPWPFPFPDA